VKRHKTDLISLFFGLVFAAIAGWAIFGGATNFGQTAGWVAIGVLVALGLAGLVSAASRREPVAAPAPDSGTAADAPVSGDGTDTLILPGADADDAPVGGAEADSATAGGGRT
jgi:hypothetical protein